MKFYIFLLFVATGLGSVNSQTYPCGVNYAPYNFDNEPVTLGLSAGEYEPGKKAYLGLSSWNQMTLDAGRIQISPPGILMPTNGITSSLITSGSVWYLKPKSNQTFSWVSSKNAETVTNAVDFGTQTSGTPSYFGSVINNGTVYVGIVSLYMGGLFYVDSNGYLGFATSYNVLICQSTVAENPVAPPNISTSASNVDTGCINNWVPYNNDKEPETKGVSADKYDCGNNAYVGKANPDVGPWRPGRIQTTGQAGLYLLNKGREIYVQNGSYYLANNPNYTYNWVVFDGNLPSNAVYVRSNVGALAFPITKIKINGDTRIGFQLGDQAAIPTDTGYGSYFQYFQILTCDPIPRYKCAVPQFKKYNLDNAPSNDGFSAGKLNGVNAYIGRSVKKCTSNCDYNIGRIQTSPSSAAGVYFADEFSSNQMFDNVTAEYLVRNVNNTYIWQSSTSGLKVKNAIEFSQTGSHPYYIGISVIDHNVFIGKVLPGKGLFYIDSNGSKTFTITYSVLTCYSSDSSNGV
ncbi:hypothetical protein PVAND_012664 [Polypedilum vanderplanki]|uniref:Uncharacterized protein n=1 Tax=Polypedilum vanderplanki TaxID=319348 RepID=A0A9J6CP11_POLVA|nr:hypothetical protein PVAND_012664 [Polypedilum vanderplanki]